MPYASPLLLGSSPSCRSSVLYSKLPVRESESRLLIFVPTDCFCLLHTQLFSVNSLFKLSVTRQSYEGTQFPYKFWGFCMGHFPLVLLFLVTGTDHSLSTSWPPPLDVWRLDSPYCRQNSMNFISEHLLPKPGDSSVMSFSLKTSYHPLTKS